MRAGSWLYGVVLTVAAMLYSRAGHGPFIAARLAGAPLMEWGALPGIAIPVIWGAFGELLVRQKWSGTAAWLIVHCLGVVAVLLLDDGAGTGLTQWTAQLREAPDIGIVTVTIYLVGQVFAWTLTIRGLLQRTKDAFK